MSASTLRVLRLARGRSGSPHDVGAALVRVGEAVFEVGLERDLNPDAGGELITRWPSCPILDIDRLDRETRQRLERTHPYLFGLDDLDRQLREQLDAFGVSECAL